MRNPTATDFGTEPEKFHSRSDWTLTASGPAHKKIPPETSNLCPFTQSAPSEHKNATTPPISSGTPTRPNAVCEAIMSFIWGLASKLGFVKSVSMAPAATRLAVMPLSPNSLAIFLLNFYCHCVIHNEALLQKNVTN